VCPLAPVDCLLRADGCDWKGTRRQRRRHLTACPMWQVMCPGCCRAVHVAEFSRHLLGHSAASESPALNPPGCPLRAYGCLACRATPSATTTNSCSGSGSSNSCGGSGSSNSCGGSGSSKSCSGSGSSNSCSGSGSSKSCTGIGSSNSCSGSATSDDAVASTGPEIGDRIPNARASY
ncbi:unnamed protein product, partial [Ectocarpus sp. 12 AP-2014]